MSGVCICTPPEVKAGLINACCDSTPARRAGYSVFCATINGVRSAIGNFRLVFGDNWAENPIGVELKFHAEFMAIFRV